MSLYVIRRKSDGKYFINPSYHSRLAIQYKGDKIQDLNDVLWTHDLSEVRRTFSTKQGASNSYGFNVPLPAVIDGIPRWKPEVREKVQVLIAKGRENLEVVEVHVISLGS